MLSKLEKKFKLIRGDEEVAYLRYAESKVNYNNALITKNMKLLVIFVLFLFLSQRLPNMKLIVRGKSVAMTFVQRN